jgi:hypothetical protein
MISEINQNNISSASKMRNSMLNNPANNGSITIVNDSNYLSMIEQ